MRTLRRAVLFVLLLTVPFQAALGASGFLCAPGTHHAQDAAAVHSHNSAMAGAHHHEMGGLETHHDSASEPGQHEPHGVAGKCKICSESCCTASAILASQATIFPPDTSLGVSTIVGPVCVSRTGDGLFRPPRNTAA